MPDEDRYIIYAYYGGKRKGQKFCARSNTNFDEIEPGLMKYIEDVPLEIAERICRNGKINFRAEDLILCSLMELIDDVW